MSVHIKSSAIEDGAYTVNFKHVRKDMDGNWISEGEELTETEKRFFAEYLEMIENTRAKEIAAFYQV